MVFFLNSITLNLKNESFQLTKLKRKINIVFFWKPFVLPRYVSLPRFFISIGLTKRIYFFNNNAFFGRSGDLQFFTPLFFFPLFITKQPTLHIIFSKVYYCSLLSVNDHFLVVLNFWNNVINWKHNFIIGAPKLIKL